MNRRVSARNRTIVIVAVLALVATASVVLLLNRGRAEPVPPFTAPDEVLIEAVSGDGIEYESLNLASGEFDECAAFGAVTTPTAQAYSARRKVRDLPNTAPELVTAVTVFADADQAASTFANFTAETFGSCFLYPPDFAAEQVAEVVEEVAAPAAGESALGFRFAASDSTFSDGTDNSSQWETWAFLRDRVIVVFGFHWSEQNARFDKLVAWDEAAFVAADDRLIEAGQLPGDMLEPEETLFDAAFWGDQWFVQYDPLDFHAADLSSYTEPTVELMGDAATSRARYHRRPRIGSGPTKDVRSVVEVYLFPDAESAQQAVAAITTEWYAEQYSGPGGRIHDAALDLLFTWPVPVTEGSSFAYGFPAFPPSTRILAGYQLDRAVVIWHDELEPDVTEPDFAPLVASMQRVSEHV